MCDLCDFISNVKTHLGPHQESHGRVLWWITCRADTWLYFFLKIYWESIFHKERCIPTLPQRRRCRAGRQTWRKSTTRPETECATSLESLNNQPGKKKNCFLSIDEQLNNLYPRLPAHSASYTCCCPGRTQNRSSSRNTSRRKTGSAVQYINHHYSLTLMLLELNI